MKKISLIGSTGSIGRQTLDVVAAHQDVLKIVALSAGKDNLALLAEQIKQFSPEIVSVPNELAAIQLQDLIDSQNKVDILVGEPGMEQVATHAKADILVTGVVGLLGLKPALAAIKLGKTIALANKETLVAAGSLVMPEASLRNATIVPVDSEHSAIHQSLHGYRSQDVQSIWLTASGGPFRNWTLEEIDGATIDDALKHPNWSMGKKITIDSATLMNKGLEIIEARWLFNLSAKNIRVVIHPQSILHSAVEFIDGSIIGQFGLPDMHLPIHYALFYPERIASSLVPRLDLCRINQLTFEEPDLKRFPCLRLAQAIALEENTLPSVLNAANEAAVEAFLAGKIKFKDISISIERVLDKHKAITKPNLEDILEADRWARQQIDKLFTLVT